MLQKKGAINNDRAAEAEESQYFSLLCSSLATEPKAAPMPPFHFQYLPARSLRKLCCWSPEARRDAVRLEIRACLRRGRSHSCRRRRLRQSRLVKSLELKENVS